MTDRCDYLVRRFDIVGCDNFSVPEGESVSKECLRPKDHEGPHLILTIFGRYIAWEKDVCPPGICECCDGEDPEDECLVVWTVAEEEAIRLINHTGSNGEEESP